MPVPYRFAGIPIESSAPIMGLRSGTAASAGFGPPLIIEQREAPCPVPDAILAHLTGRYETRLGTQCGHWLIDSKFDGTFVIDREASRLCLYSETSPPSAVCCDVLVRRVLPRLMSVRGAVTLHAASVATGGAGLVLLGSSGAGKSTTSAALAAMPGWDVLSDDLSTVWPGDPPTVAPSGAGVCIWEASLRGLGLDPALCAPMPAYDGKFRFDPPGRSAIDPVPVRAFVFLSREAGLAAPALTPVDRLRGMAQATRQIQVFNPAGEEYAGAVARLAAIASRVKMVRLSYPASYDALPAVAALLAEVARA